jgi:DEAD/DEAH box helicase domain-containing protein
VDEVLTVLAEHGLVHRIEDDDGTSTWQWTSESYPADAVSLRSISSDNFVIVDITRGANVIGETSFGSAFETLHEKAIYLLEAQLYQVERLDVEGRKAYVRRIDCDYYTDAITYTKVTVLDGFAPNRGEVHVSSRVVGFKKIKFYTNENVGSGDLDLPQQEMHTTAWWLTVPGTVMAGLPFAPDDRRDGIVGLAFALRQVAQLLLMCDRQDVGVSIDSGDEDAGGAGAGTQGEPRIFIYDNYPGGIGFSEPLSGKHDELLVHTRSLIAGCTCEQGCPGCVGPVGNTGPLAKAVALRILDALLTGTLTAHEQDGRELYGDREPERGHAAISAPVAAHVPDEVPF